MENHPGGIAKLEDRSLPRVVCSAITISSPLPSTSSFYSLLPSQPHQPPPSDRHALLTLSTYLRELLPLNVLKYLSERLNGASDMATLDSLKQALRQTAKTEAPSSLSKQPLSDTQQSAGFDILSSRLPTPQNSVTPHLSQLLSPLFDSRDRISVLEIEPGPRSVLDHVSHRMRQKIRRYTLLEPNSLFLASVKTWLHPDSETVSPLPGLERLPEYHRTLLGLDNNAPSDSSTSTDDSNGEYDIIFFSSGMYCRLRKKSIERALAMLGERPGDGKVIVFHNPNLRIDGLVCHETASFSTGDVLVADNDETLDRFALFMAGFVIEDKDEDKTIRAEWRTVCRILGRRDESYLEHLLFSMPNTMTVFTRHATTVSELTTQVPLVDENKAVKDRDARLHPPAAIVKPTEIKHVQECVRWALKYKFSLTVIDDVHRSIHFL
ncbi:uncharacterized protein BO97DRAFT_419908 [Aspergillus homomorphus CBS 101889]|uniref:Uncharacterized protein n=1 Tax=Aspergillus homomorphus (strain CBS 101889) TaxID=1450537 RepID=A0A395IBU8_ASPHC|nr:hypothetical protein BO97DRAFT_419908 [Aspergillus homomorphus CBS 101889]RAL17677.1 hypothetical protein BO97DRAFT_419908 [Aspergillus homomorphus CBS 101889]